MRGIFTHSGGALNGILKVCVHEVNGFDDIARMYSSRQLKLNNHFIYLAYYVAIEVDSYGQFELVAKTKIIDNTKNPQWNQVSEQLSE